MNGDSRTGIGRRMAKGAAWTVGLGASLRGIGVVSTLILARLLVPEDFGIVALATTVVMIFELFGEFGFDVYLVRHQNIGRAHYDTAWTLTIIRNAIVAIVILAAAPFLAGFFGDARLESVLVALAIVTFLFGFTNVGIVDFRKRLEFHREFVMFGVAKLAAFFVTVGLAFLWRNYWALVVGIAVKQTATAILSYVMHPFRPRLKLSVWREIFDFSKWLLFNSIGRLLYRKAPTLVISRMGDMQGLGLYSLAWEISNLATSELGAPIRRTLLPGYSKLASRLDELRETFRDVFSLMVLGMAPIAVTVLVCADPLVRVMLGTKWLNAVPLMEILALAGLFRTLAPSANSIFVAIGKPRITAITLFATLAVFLPSLLWATAEFGVTGAAWAVAGASALHLCLQTTYLYTILRITPVYLVSHTWRTCAGVVLMYVYMSFVESEVEFSLSFQWQVLELGVLLIGGATILVATVLGLWAIGGRPRGPEAMIAGAVIQKWRKRAAAAV